MTLKRTLVLAALALLALPLASAPTQAGVFIGVGARRSYYHSYRPAYFRPRVYVGLPPVVVAPAPAPVYYAPAYAPPPVYLQPAPLAPALPCPPLN